MSAENGPSQADENQEPEAITEEDFRDLFKKSEEAEDDKHMGEAIASSHGDKQLSFGLEMISLGHGRSVASNIDKFEPDNQGKILKKLEESPKELKE